MDSEDLRLVIESYKNQIKVTEIMLNRLEEIAEKQELLIESQKDLMDQLRSYFDSFVRVISMIMENKK